MDNSKIREQIEWLNDIADGMQAESITLHIAKTLELLLAVRVAAEGVRISFDPGCDCESCVPAERLYLALKAIEDA